LTGVFRNQRKIGFCSIQNLHCKLAWLAQCSILSVFTFLERSVDCSEHKGTTPQGAPPQKGKYNYNKSGTGLQAQEREFIPLIYKGLFASRSKLTQICCNVFSSGASVFGMSKCTLDPPDWKLPRACIHTNGHPRLPPRQRPVHRVCEDQSFL
jgi:hypothetical protein